MSENQNQEASPIVTVGRYAGKPIDKLPNSYLRWMIGQDFPKLWVDAAKKKLSQSDYNDIYMTVSRHAVDMFSKRFSHLWLKHIREKGEAGDGMGTFIAKLAEIAWENGTDISKHRHSKDGTVKELGGIKYVFGINDNCPDYKELITVMD